MDFIQAEQPDILCLQETKAKPGQAEVDLPEYTEYWNSAERAGYSGTAIFSKVATDSYSQSFHDEIQSKSAWQDDPYGNPLNEGRLQIAEFPNFYLVNVYVPNSKPDLSRLQLREQVWDPALVSQLKLLEQSKPIVICGDFNAAHTEIDLARPKANTHNAGFTKEERQGITNLINAGFIDTFRQFHPEEQRYTWWSHWAHSRKQCRLAY